MTIAFIAGIILTLGYKDFYPELEQRFRRRRRRFQYSLDAIEETGPVRHISLGTASIYQEKHVASSDQGGNVSTAGVMNDGGLVPDIKNGIEGTIGNTPLIRIKSLSEATGCEILAKAEVLTGGLYTASK